MFFRQELIHISTLLAPVVGTTVFKKLKGSVVTNRIGVKFGTIVLQVNTHQLTESDF